MKDAGHVADSADYICEPADQAPGPEDRPPQPRSRTLLLLVAVAAVGLAGVAVAASTNRLDTVLLFVGVPCVLAVGVGLMRGSGGWGSMFQVVTVVLLLASALLREAAICVLLAAPLVYGVAALAYAGTATMRAGRSALALGPLLAVVLIEGVVPGGRINPEQEAVASRMVADRCDAFESALARGPRINQDADRGPLLDLFPYPTPTAATGAGLAVGDVWSLAIGDGILETRVAARTASALEFEITDGASAGSRGPRHHAVLDRWVTVRSGTLAWTQTADGCQATMTVRYKRHLDPALWFGPVTAAFMDAGTAAFLAGLD
ncbi:MAG: hypothetical protein ACRCYX_04885 [Dermatophilaceae bacterium]